MAIPTQSALRRFADVFGMRHSIAAGVLGQHEHGEYRRSRALPDTVPFFQPDDASSRAFAICGETIPPEAPRNLLLDKLKLAIAATNTAASGNIRL